MLLDSSASTPASLRLESSASAPASAGECCFLCRRVLLGSSASAPESEVATARARGEERGGDCTHEAGTLGSEAATARAERGARRRLRSRGAESEAATARALVHWSLLVPPRHRQSSGGGRGGFTPPRARGGERGGDCARGARSEAATARVERGVRRRLRARGEERGGESFPSLVHPRRRVLLEFSAYAPQAVELGGVRGGLPPPGPASESFSSLVHPRQRVLLEPGSLVHPSPRRRVLLESSASAPASPSRV